MSKNLIVLLVFSVLTGCTGQVNSEKKKPNSEKIQNLGGPFENGEFMYIGMPKNINPVDTSPGWEQSGQKLLITGTIFKNDGKTPAPGIILYYYHTDINGYYANHAGLDKRVLRHGYIRSWVKSDENGNYAIYTVRPAPYPNSNEPAHIHPSIKEPNLEKEYYIDEFVFDDDRLLTGSKRKAMDNRGGSGVLRVLEKDHLQIAEHNIILGLNIPNYPGSRNQEFDSGKAIGEDILSFTPFHAWGPDKGTKTCPICKYGRYHGILYFVGNLPDWTDIKSWLIFLEKESTQRKKYLKAYFIYGNSRNFNQEKRIEELRQIGNELALKHTALTFVPSFDNQSSEIYLNKINPKADNTILIYRHSNIIDKFVNLEATEANFKLITTRLTETTNEFFQLPTPKKE